MKEFETIPADLLVRAHGSASCDLSGVSPAARSIIMAESGGDPTAKNPRSTAFGLGQLLIANRRHYMGANAGSTSCSAQLGAFNGYVSDRYGTAERALSFRKKHGWY
jgi:hypothetical protein